MIVAIVVSAYLVIGLVFALRSLAIEPAPRGAAPAARGEKAGLFLAAMFGWPLVALLLLVIVLLFWDLLFIDEQTWNEMKSGRP